MSGNTSTFSASDLWCIDYDDLIDMWEDYYDEKETRELIEFVMGVKDEISHQKLTIRNEIEALEEQMEDIANEIKKKEMALARVEAEVKAANFIDE